MYHIVDVLTYKLHGLQRRVYMCYELPLSRIFVAGRGGGGSCGILDVVVLKFYAY